MAESVINVPVIVTGVPLLHIARTVKLAIGEILANTHACHVRECVLKIQGVLVVSLDIIDTLLPVKEATTVFNVQLSVQLVLIMLTVQLAPLILLAAIVSTAVMAVKIRVTKHLAALGHVRQAIISIKSL